MQKKFLLSDIKIYMLLMLQILVIQKKLNSKTPYLEIVLDEAGLLKNCWWDIKLICCIFIENRIMLDFWEVFDAHMMNIWQW